MGKRPEGTAGHFFPECQIYEDGYLGTAEQLYRGNQADQAKDKPVLKTKGGLFITANAQDKPEIAEVIAVGPGGVVDGKEVEMQLKVGDHVIMGKYAGTAVKIDGEEIIILSQNDILAVVED